MTTYTDNNVLSQEQIVDNFNKYEQLCQRLGIRTVSVNAMLNDIGARLAVAPASSQKAFHAAYPGGLVEHSLRVAKNALTLHKTMKVFEHLSSESVVFAALFHDLGKVGQPGPDGQDYYVVETSEWHREKLGKFFKVNESIQWMQNIDHTSMLFFHYGIVPTQDEYLAIRLNDGPYAEENSKYAMKEPPLALLIHMADRLACEEEKSFVK